MYYFYLLQSIKKITEIYTGSTNNLKSRFNEHNQGNVFSTKRYTPWRLVYYEAYASEKDARLREQKFKRHGKGNQELKKRLENSLKILGKGEGFTLIELLLSISVIMLIAGLSAPVYQSFQVRNDLDIATVATAQSLRRAQMLSQAVDGDTTWGVKAQTGSVVLFKGANYAARDTSYDEIFDVQESIAPSGVSEIVFTKFAGLPQTAGTIIYTSNANETRTITINAEGMISF